MARALPRAAPWPELPPALVVRRLTLSDFRGYARLRLDAGPGPIVLHGPNGAGKTNLLEALSFLAPGRGLRRARLAEVDRWGGGPFAVAAEILGQDGVVAIGTGRDPETERRVLRIDGKPVRGTGQLAEVVSVVWLTPEMDRLLQDGPAARRRFLDRLVVAAEPAHAQGLARYEHAIRERARLLQTPRADPAWLDALERQAAEAGVAVAAARREIVAGLARVLAEAGDAFPCPDLALDGDVEAWLGEAPALAVEERLAARLAALRGRDRETGTTATGPHRSDLLVGDPELGHPAAASSTGRQKALLVSIVLAEARLRARRRGSLPVLLLDEVAAHLDATRREALYDGLQALGVQAWLTGTDADLFRPLAGRAPFLRIDNATVQGP
jgi:DNA replication and repair protein RecF